VEIHSTNVPTFLTATGFDLIKVGNSGSVEGIRSPLEVTATTFGRTSLNVDDGADSTAHTVTLSRFFIPLSPAVIGLIRGLAPADILYPPTGILPSVNITTGAGTNTVDVQRTIVPTDLINNGGQETIDVSNGGNTAAIKATLNVEKPLLVTTGSTNLVVD